MADRVKVEGAARLERTLHAAADDLEDMSQAQQESARLVQQRAQAAAPKDTGTLANSLTVQEIERGQIAVASQLIYAPVIHYGWAAHNISPQPFLATALADSTSLVVDLHQRQAQHILSQVKGD
jgi:multidrug efflux pump subunit AcrA (membrane-fusion protein)